jgi:DNA polymerase-3 subunit beta
MKFKSERDILVEALSAASRVVATRLIGASSGVLLSLTGNQLVVTGTDLDITVRTSVDVIGIEDGSSVVPARLIVDAVRSLEAGAVTISSNDENVEVSLGRAKFSLRTFSVVDYPKLPPVTGPLTSIAAVDLIQGLNQVVRAAANDDSSPVFCLLPTVGHFDSSLPTPIDWPYVTFLGLKESEDHTIFWCRRELFKNFSERPDHSTGRPR